MRACLVVMFCLSLIACGEQPLREFSGKPAAPALSVPAVHGGELSVQKLAGKPVIVNFWATWCPPCRAEIPAMNRAWAELVPHGVEMLAVSVGESSTEVRSFMQQVKMDFPVGFDSDNVASAGWPVDVLPTTYIVDAQGRVIYQAQGPREWDDPALIQKILALR